MSNKTISINTSFFNIAGSKSKKKRQNQTNEIEMGYHNINQQTTEKTNFN